ncbi:MAG: aspartate-semialdehyde dehydrogenase [bacterium]
MKKQRIGIVGIGTVGTELVKVLRERDYPVEELRILATRERDEEIAGETFRVKNAAETNAFDGLDLVLFAGTEGAKGASQLYGWAAAAKGAVVVDNGDDFRMDPRVPLVIPEINAHAMKKHQGFIANPNCSTIVALMALAPLHKAVKIRRFIASTYQSVSGTGRDAILELERQSKEHVEGRPYTVKAYAHRIAFNVLPQVGSFKKDGHGNTTEEVKMLNETRKILEEPGIRVASTCVRVPVFYGHSEVLNIEFEKPMSPDRAREILSKAEGVRVVDEPAAGQYPLPIDAAGKDDILVGRIREDDSVENGLSIFVAGDNIRKGAALNAVQIAERLFFGK